MLFNDNLICRREKEAVPFYRGPVPFDAMFYEKRSKDNPSSKNGSFFPGGNYVFEKSFRLSEKEKGNTVYLLFESIYRDADFFINGKKAGHHDYGYTPCLLDVTDYLLPEENLVRVEVHFLVLR